MTEELLDSGSIGIEEGRGSTGTISILAAQELAATDAILTQIVAMQVQHDRPGPMSVQSNNAVGSDKDVVIPTPSSVVAGLWASVVTGLEVAMGE
ncbi:hypothetical protein V6N13_046293 [Hibiscus sabdariffa]